MSETIASISTPFGVGAISIVRMSGEKSLKIATQLFSCKTEIMPRVLNLGTFKFENISEKCLMVFFKAPHTFTGEDMVEFQIHGGELLTEKVLSACIEKGARLAENGEFSKRAFINGKMSLDSAEGMIDVINATSEAEIKAGYNLMSGHLMQKVKSYQEKIKNLLAEVEVNLDYPEHDDETKTLKQVNKEILEIKTEISNLLKTAQAGKIIKSGINVAIIGRPNVGKSSLLNALIGSERAIVTDVEGTTRDTISESINYKSFKINFIDTAGIRESQDKVEKFGIERSKEAIKNADIVLCVLDNSKKLNDEDNKILQEIKNKQHTIILNKTDINNTPIIENAISISAKNGTNIDCIKDEIIRSVKADKIDTSGVILTNIRHINALKNAFEKIENFENKSSGLTLDIIAMQLTEIWQELGKITGETEIENVIDTIFNKFCLGK